MTNAIKEKQLQLSKRLADIDLKPVVCEQLTERMVWDSHRTNIWQAKSFEGRPSFYPVFRYKDYYSYSPVPLLLLKKEFIVNKRVVRMANIPERDYLSSHETIDKQIFRIGGPVSPKFKIKSAEEYTAAIAEALKKDVAMIESKNPDKTNVIMCGGKDSLNLLFLPWENPVLILSAMPEYITVKQFIQDHQLPYDLIQLKDNDASMLEEEIFANFCMNDLKHCRWLPQLVGVTKKLGQKAIIWKGQLGGAFMHSRWKTYCHPKTSVDRPWLVAICQLFRGRGEHRIRSLLDISGVTQRRAYRALWQRGAMWQGAHLSFIRLLTGTLTISAYHGPEMAKVLKEADLFNSVKDDVRPLLGERLFGKNVNYPDDIYGKGPSRIRLQKSDFVSFNKVLEKTNLKIKLDLEFKP